MNEYRLSVIDDALGDRRPWYDKVLNDPRSGLTVSSWMGSETDPIDTTAHAYVLDLALWPAVGAMDIIKRLPTRRPVIIVSNKIKDLKNEDFGRLLTQLMQTKACHEFIPWDEFEKGNEDQHQGIRFHIRHLLFDFYQTSPSFTPGPAESVTILHLSDLQFGDPGERSGLDALSRTLSRNLRAATKIDFVVTTGDITYSGSPVEFRAARGFYAALMEGLWGAGHAMSERLLFAPGNHDVDLRIAKAGDKEFSFKNKDLEPNKISVDYSTLARASYRAFVAGVNPIVYGRPALMGEAFVIENFLPAGFRFVVLDTAASITQSQPAEARVASAQLRHIESRIQESPFGSPKSLTNIVLQHHPFHCPKTSVESVEPYNDLMDFYVNIDATVVLCGHGHEMSRKQLSEGSPVDGLVQAMCKSARLTAPDSLRGFNVLSFTRIGTVAQSVSVDSFEFRQGQPARIGKAPPMWQLGLKGTCD